MKSIAVFCGSSTGNNPKFIETAKEVGKILAQQKITLVYGGAQIGIMGALANAVLEHNGQVIGVIPKFLTNKEIVHQELTELHEVKTMHERKLLMNEKSDAVMALPGGFGTLEELFEMVTWSQLGLHQKPIGILNIDGFYNHLLAFIDHTLSQELMTTANRKLIIDATDPSDLLHQMREYQPQDVPSWIKKEYI